MRIVRWVLIHLIVFAVLIAAYKFRPVHRALILDPDFGVAVNEAAKRRKPDILLVGDSIVDRMRFHEDLLPPSVLNCGLPRDGARELLWRIERGQFDGLTPRVVGLLIGTNDTDKRTPETIAADVHACAEAMRRKMPGARVVVFALLPRSSYSAEAKAVNIHLARTEKLADLGALLTDPACFTDGLHLSRRGYLVLVPAMMDTINHP